MNEITQVEKKGANAIMESSISAISFDNARDAVNKGDVAYLTKYLSMSEAHTGDDGKTLLHYAAMSGQARVISELLAAGLDPHARCSKGDTPLDLATRNGHHDAMTLFFCHSPPPPSPTEAGESSGCLEAWSAGSKSGSTKKQGSIDGRLIFGRKPWRAGSNSNSGEGWGEAVVKVKRSPKKGRGKRPGFPQGVAAEASISTPCGQYVWNGGPFQAGWVPHTDSDGYRYYWNEALQEYRWRDASGNPSAAFPEPSPSHSSTPLGSIYEGLSPTFSNNNDIPWEIPDAAWADASSPVHSPGWPSPRGANGGFMFLPAAAVKLSGSPRAQDVATPTPTYGFSTPPPSPPPPTPTSLPPLSLKDRGLNPAASRDGELKLEHKAGQKVSTLADAVEEEQSPMGNGTRDNGESLDTGTDNCTDRSADNISATSASGSPWSSVSTESTNGSTEGARDSVAAEDDVLLASPITEGPVPSFSATAARPTKDDPVSALVHEQSPSLRGASGENQMLMSGVPTVGEVIEVRSDERANVESCYRAVASGKARYD